MSSSPSSSFLLEPPTKRKRAEPQSDDNSDSTTSSSESEAEDATLPLSHAEKRRRKRKERLAQTKGKELKEPLSKKRKLADGTASSTNTEGKPQRQNSVWVGNLSFKTTPADLRTFFDGVGEITRIHMPMKPGTRPGMKGENRGFAYVDFATSDSKMVAITLSERHLTGRKLLIKDGDDFTGRPASPSVEGPENETSAVKGKTLSKTARKILNVQKQPPAPTLFIGNLGFETTEDQIKELLEAHRKKSKKEKDRKVEAAGEGDEIKTTNENEPWIRRVRMGTFEDSGLCKGFAFVDFSSVDNATSTLINPRNHHLNGRNLVVEYASAGAVRRGPNKQHVGGGEGKQKPSKPRDRATGRPRSRPEHKPSEKDTSYSITEASGTDSQVQIDVHEEAADTGHEQRPRKGTDGPRQKGPRHRPKPGAALAQAKRQSAAIVPTTGKKIVF
ncbi:hypothetical protein E1B28_004784 [Marasmius oreades]|uniref:RRM domain-containing protein n=1 Tax=Marasmius oreades TaxID=181124 RepID=A0A9P8ADC3_9AGAR|nr:uncharacterized protein E1B28_004784 [Marasmius oreades]KAG7097439.1 hypothetical protein E1B28_004784 [Marasmius oreades]